MNVVPFAKPAETLADALRRFADDLDECNAQMPDSALVLMIGRGLSLHSIGAEIQHVEAIGSLETAKTHLVNKLVG